MDEDQLYRRIVKEHINSDGKVNSAAFKLRGKPDGSISVDLAKETTVQDSVRRGGSSKFGLASLVARAPRSLGFTVKHDPILDKASPNYNPAHALIEGENTKSKCRTLAEHSTVMLKPPERSVEPSAQ